MVYNFTLPPLLLHALISGEARRFSDWARTLNTPSNQSTFFNFTASHDGIGVRPLEGLLLPAQIGQLAARVRQNGGRVSVKQNPDGSTSPYELNITYLDALKDPDAVEDPFHVPRFLASQAVALALPGVPGIYIHSLLGSPNWAEGVRLTGRARTINRAPLPLEKIHAALADRTSTRARIFSAYREMLRVRTHQPAFHPSAPMQVLQLDDRVFSVKRSRDRQTLFALTNFTTACLTLALPGSPGAPEMIDLIHGERVDPASIWLSAYQTRWLTTEQPASPNADS
jgi:sucrose phosphorylase